MARSIDSRVLASLPPLIRAAETGPKIAQKYVHAPALFRGRKFDLRFMVRGALTCFGGSLAVALCQVRSFGTIWARQ